MRGVRRYLSRDLNDGDMALPITDRVERLGAFCRAVLRRISRIPPEVGRLMQHIRSPI